MELNSSLSSYWNKSRTIELVAPWTGPDFEPAGVKFLIGDGEHIYSGQKIASFQCAADEVVGVDFDVISEHSGTLRHHCNDGYKARSLQMVASVELAESNAGGCFDEELFDSYANFSQQTASKFEAFNFYPIRELPFDRSKLLETLGVAHLKFQACDRSYDPSVLGKAVDTALRHTSAVAEAFYSSFMLKEKFSFAALPADFPFYAEQRLNKLHEVSLSNFCQLFNFDIDNIPWRLK